MTEIVTATSEPGLRSGHTGSRPSGNAAERAQISRQSLVAGSLAATAWAGLGGLSATSAQAAASSRPARDSRPLNVLIVKSDEHNPFVTSVTGTPFVQTPNIAGLAARGTVF
jgi:choline-sulfatase